VENEFGHQLFVLNFSDIDLHHGKLIRKFGINDTKLKYQDFVCLIITKLNTILKNIKPLNKKVKKKNLSKNNKNIKDI